MSSFSFPARSLALCEQKEVSPQQSAVRVPLRQLSSAELQHSRCSGAKSVGSYICKVYRLSQEQLTAENLSRRKQHGASSSHGSIRTLPADRRGGGTAPRLSTSTRSFGCRSGLSSCQHLLTKEVLLKSRISSSSSCQVKQRQAQHGCHDER